MKIGDYETLLNAKWYIKMPKQLNKIAGHICIDSRKIQKGDIFLALIGKDKDGHDYIKEACKKKPSLIIVSQIKEDYPSHIPVLIVEDTLKALHTLAFLNRKEHPIPLIAITGSAGKTTTKELIYHFLSIYYTVCKSKKNLNNHIGLPLTLLELKEEHEIAVVELGMNHSHELEMLSEMCQPDIAIITNIGTSHTGNLGSKRKILQAKMEITKGIKDGILVINGDDSYLKKIKKAKQYEICFCGIKHYTSLEVKNMKASLNGTSFEIKEKDTWYPVYFKTPGKHLIIDLLLAFQIGLYFDIPLDIMIESLNTFQMEQNRMEIIVKDTNTIISDCYNASYDSCIGVLELLEQEEKTKVLILGDMLELGKFSRKYHIKLAKKIRKMKNTIVYLIGTEVKAMLPILKHVKYYENKKELVKKLKKESIQNSIILIKGANALGLHDIKNNI